jgi:hypothetical protein
MPPKIPNKIIDANAHGATVAMRRNLKAITLRSDE